MDASKLLSGIAVVIDDAITSVPDTSEASDEEDLIIRIIDWFETEWKTPFVKQTSLPSDDVWPNLLSAASFVLLDWCFWGSGSEELRQHMIEDIKRFLISARQNLVPVFILTNEAPDDVKVELNNLSNDVYDESSASSNFVFVEQKSKFWSQNSVNLQNFETWVYGNASVYTLKTWDRVLEEARSELFEAMCQRSIDWPRVFWETYKTDGAAPSVSLTNMINDSLRGRMRVDAFEAKHLESQARHVSRKELRQLIMETSFRSGGLSNDEVRCGDLFRGNNAREFWLNLRPDCDCIPRDNGKVENIDVYCIKGDKLSDTEENEKFRKEYGNFEEYISNSFVFGVVDENGESKSVLFRFKKLQVMKYSQLRDKRVGRLLHPYITRVQQRYAWYLQRQGLPRIPADAVGDPDPESDKRN